MSPLQLASVFGLAFGALVAPGAFGEEEPAENAVLRPLVVLSRAASGPVRDAALGFMRRHDGTTLDVDIEPVVYPGDKHTPLVAPALRLRRDIANAVTRSGSTARPGMIVLVGEPDVLPVFHVLVGEERVQTDFFLGDLDGDGCPELPVARVVGAPETIVRTLVDAPSRSRIDTDRRAVILCSEPTPIHLETKCFFELLAGRGYHTSFARGAPDRLARETKLVAAADVIVHFGHGDPHSLRNRFGQPFLRADAMPRLDRGPIALIDGCATAPVGSPLVHAFFAAGGRLYIGSSAVVLGMNPAQYTNRLMGHFFRSHDAAPGRALAALFHDARRRYVGTCPGLRDRLLQLATTGRSGRDADLLTVAQWVVLGDPASRLAALPPRPLPFAAVPVAPGSLVAGERSIAVDLGPSPRLGVLALSTQQDVASVGGALVVEQDGAVLHRVETGSHIVYQDLDDVAIGGYSDGETFHGRFLLPLRWRKSASTLRLRWDGDPAGAPVVELGSSVEIWPGRALEEYALVAPPRSSEAPGVTGDARADAGSSPPLRALVLSKDEAIDELFRLLRAVDGLEWDYPRAPSGLARYVRPRGDEAASPYPGPQGYRLVIVDELPNGRRSLPAGYLERLRDWVADGGSLLMVGGWYAFGGRDGRGGYDETPLEAILPVEILGDDDFRFGRFALESAPGAPPTVAALAWGRAPIVGGLNVTRARSGAAVWALLASAPGSSPPIRAPLIALHRHGKGRVAVFTTCFARGISRALPQWGDYPKLWKELLERLCRP